MPQLAAIGSTDTPLNPITVHPGTPADDGRSTLDRAAWADRLRDPDTSQVDVNRTPVDVVPNPPDLDRPVGRVSRWLGKPNPQTYRDPAAQLLPESAGLHAEILLAVSPPTGEQNPAWTTRNTFRLPAEPWDAALYITPQGG